MKHGRTRLACLLAAVGLAGPACANDDSSSPPPGIASSSIVSTADGSRLWIASPDDDAVVAVDPATLEVVEMVPIAGAPDEVAIAGGEVVVTLSLAPEVALVDTATAGVVRVRVPCGGTGAVVASADGALAWIACPNDDLVLELDVATATVARTFASPGRPTALARVGDRLVATASRLGLVRTLALADGSVIDERTVGTAPDHRATQLDSLAVAPDGTILAAYQDVDNDSNRARPPEDGGYGSVVDGDPRIEPRLDGPCAARYARFDGGARVLSGPSAIATAGGLVWVAHRYTDNVAVLDCGTLVGGQPDLLRTFRVGRGPRGLHVAEDGRTAWVDVAFNHSVARLELGSATPREPLVRDATLELRRDVTPVRASAAALAGRSLFFDAVDTHLTPSGIVTCATCHPGGGEDGLAWFLHTVNVGPKLRRTPAAWAARPSLAPFHWDGEFDDVATLTRTTIVELMGGDALLVDASSVAAYLAELPPPPARPVPASETALWARGEELFRSSEVGCAECHSGPETSDGLSHAVVSTSRDPDAELPMVETPTLRAVRARPPYLHDGRAATLRDVLTTDDVGDTHGTTSHLAPADIDALVAYLESL